MASYWLAIYLESSYFVNIGCMLNFSLLGCVEVGFLKRYPYPWHTDYTNLNAVVALAPAGNQIKLDWAGKLGLGQAN